MSQQTKPSLTKRQAHWLSHIQAAQAQNLPLMRYANQNGLSIKGLYQAKTKLKQLGYFGNEAATAAASTPFASVKLSPGCSLHSTQVAHIVKLPNGIDTIR